MMFNELNAVSLDRMVLVFLQTINLFCHKARIWQTGGQTERRQQELASNMVRCVLKSH